MDILSQVSDLVQGRVPDKPPLAAIVPERDDDSSLGEFLGDAEGQSFMIEYVDSGGNHSRRRISVWGLRKNDNGIPLLVARCHERNATRTFRVDRIRCCIDYDGEVHDDVPRYISDTFGMAIVIAGKKGKSSSSKWPEIRERIKSDAIILAAISRADYAVHINETHAATDYLARKLERQGERLTDDEVELIKRYVAKLRPDEETIARALDKVRDRGPNEIKDTLIAACHVMDADGRRHPKEREFLNALAQEWLAITLF